MNKMIQTVQRISATLGMAAALGIACSAAQAATPHTWDFGSGAGGNGSYPSDDRRYVSSEGLEVAISGWYGRDTSSSTLTESTALRHWGGGLGLDRNNNDEHTVDNNGRDELIAFVFDEAVSLTEMKFGWYENDSDATILYQTDASAGFSGLGGTSISGLTSNGYSLLGNLIDPGTSTSSIPGDLDAPAPATPVYSKVWLVGAYLQGVTGNSSGYAGAFDSFKIKTLVAQRMPGTSVPLPATLALLGLGMMAMRRRAV